jgi:putative acetyltransferase
MGGFGIYPTPGLPEGFTEHVKFYVDAFYQGQGIGLKLMEMCFESANWFEYRQL